MVSSVSSPSHAQEICIQLEQSLRYGIHIPTMHTQAGFIYLGGNFTACGELTEGHPSQQERVGHSWSVGLSSDLIVAQILRDQEMMSTTMGAPFICRNSMQVGDLSL